MSRLLLVSNRLPVTVKVEKDTVSVVRSAGGLATGLRRPHERSGGLWIGWPGDVSRLSESQRSRVDAQLAELRCVPLTLSASEVSRYYEGYSNRVLWPLCHYMLDRIPRQDRDWEVYRKVNERFADLVAKHYQPGDTIWVHDYQLMLVPGMLRQRLPGARIGYFHHIPFPSSEIFSTLPRRQELLKGLLGADLIGFHTVSYVRHFSGALLRQLGLDTDIDRVIWEGRDVRVGAFPMGIDAQAFESLASDAGVLEEVANLRRSAEGQRILLGIDRLDYTKGIPRRLLAVQRVLERTPAWRGRLRFVQVAVPSRTSVEAYANYRELVDELVGRINGTYGTVHNVPVHYLYRSFNERQLVSLYRGADVMLVTPVRDGMNLVAKEFCAARPDEDGVLVLSEFAGAAAELGGALVVNPYDVDALADAIEKALGMAEEDRRARMRTLRKQVKSRDVHWWTSSFLDRLQALPAVTVRSEAGAQEALARMKQAEHLQLLLDYDGTLVGYAPRPELAAPDAALKALLARLVARPGVSVSIVSGRPKETLEEWLGDLPIGLYAEHGLWSRPSPGEAWRMLEGVRFDWKERVRPELESFSTRVPGSFVEEKTASLAWHYRLVDAEFGAIQSRELRLHLAEKFAGQPIDILPGDKVVEIRPQGVHKGRVVGEATRGAPPGALVVAMGDDRTDEDLFASVPSGGLTIHAGNKPTRAAHRVKGPSEVRELLAGLLEP
ncbi:bifunctional alpha,alpha-trehalose-phosphate synthase (UDP-forming)/trehalose-phosphatase [Myxococcus sp. Y35]|uniref:bifunctional alpha,alpha-trehalose-phosphate synthase (UDP-forming)/trehalose-phosphatase n=1 Tax=Pseudomyxococcus flavus TaxID=3115648 RepID=UPI003CE694A6